jgi:hypothetical protein
MPKTKKVTRAFKDRQCAHCELADERRATEGETRLVYLEKTAQERP